MELLLRLQGCHGPEHTRDVAVRVEPDHTVADLAAALAPAAGRRPPFQLQRAGEVLAPTASLSDTGLLTGDVLDVVDPDRAPAPALDRQGVEMTVTAGVDTGRSRLLPPGRHVVGRAAGADIVLQDPLVSKGHAIVEVSSSGRVLLVAGQSTNATLVNGEPLPDGTRRRVEDDDLVQVGGTTIRFAVVGGPPRTIPDRLGHIPFHRTPHTPVVLTPVTFPALGNVPAAPEPQRFSPLTALVPLVAGILLAVLLSNPRYLLFTLVSPVMAFASFRQSRSTSAQRHTRAVAAFRQRAAERHDAVRAALADERQARLRAAPDLADLVTRAVERRRDLWGRSREHDDFLSLRVGTGHLPSVVTVAPEGTGDHDLLEELRRPLAGCDTIRSVPVSVPLADHGVAALVGSVADTDEVVSALLLQAVCMHSPEELVILGALSPERPVLDWLKWVPHTRAASSPLAGPHLAEDTAAAEAMVRRLLDVAERRMSAGRDGLDPRWPWMLLVIDKDLDVDTPLLTSLLRRCPEAGISVVWLSDDDHRIRREASTVVECRPPDQRSTVWTTSDAGREQVVDLDRVRPDIATTVALALAPLRDASATSATSGIPRMVPLFDALGVTTVSEGWVRDRWCTPRPYSLPAPVGIAADGPLVLDLVEHGHGPHGLIAGTSGSGKSELLQSIVAGLVACTPPTRLNLLFVDYKGGAASDVFADLPHTVGRVTNLNAALARRALVSLRAELNRRMDVMRGRAKDIEQMLLDHPDDAPPSLVIILDEFATLVKEIPEFVDGIVDIAQRGRSLGIHLLLSTQRPAGAVNDNILANCNLRISLRMIDPAESQSIIGTTDAAAIPVPLKGRAYGRLGPGQVVQFQSAFTGAPLQQAARAGQVLAQPFEAGRLTGFASPELEDGSGRTQLDALLEAVGKAAVSLGVHAAGQAQRPWRDELATEVGLASVRQSRLPDGTPVIAGRHLCLGLADDPARQRQDPVVIDLEDGSGLVVFGTGGSGKTTLLRTAALCAALDDEAAGGGGLTILGLDFSSGALTALTALPQCGMVATADDLEAVTRLLARLQGAIDDRRRSGRGEGAERQTWAGDRILLLVDSYGTFVEVMEARKQYGWTDVLARIVTDGRQVGIHTVLTAEQRGAVRGSLMASISNRLVLRQADESDYVLAGIPQKLAKGLDLPPGRGFLDGDRMVQVATPDAPASSVSGRTVLHLPELPAHVPDEDVRLQAMHVRLGVADVSLDPVIADLGRFDLMVAGPPGSGRSTALATIARQVAGGGVAVHAFGTPDSPLRRLDGVAERWFTDAAGVRQRLVELAAELSARADGVDEPERTLVVIDDIDLLEDALGHQGLPAELLATRGVRVVAAAASTMAIGMSLLSALQRRARSRLYLQPASADDARAQFPQLAISLRPGLPMPVGRGIFVQSATEAHVLQVVEGRPPSPTPAG